MAIRSIDDLAKAVAKSKDWKNFAKDNPDDAKIENEIENVLKQEVERLQEYIQDNMIEYNESYDPKVTKHPRTGEHLPTGRWMASFDVNTVKYNKTGDTLIATIGFIPELAYHESWIEGGQKGYVPWLLETGWDIRDHIPVTNRFTYFKGSFYIKRAIERFMQDNPYDMKIEVYFENEYGVPEKYI